MMWVKCTFLKPHRTNVFLNIYYLSIFLKRTLLRYSKSQRAGKQSLQWREVEQCGPWGLLWWEGGIFPQAICYWSHTSGLVDKEHICMLSWLTYPHPHFLRSRFEIEVFVENYIEGTRLLTKCLQVSYHLAHNSV